MAYVTIYEYALSYTLIKTHRSPSHKRRRTEEKTGDAVAFQQHISEYGILHGNPQKKTKFERRIHQKKHQISALRLIQTK
jgi:hypothetical protein